jgi:hypothetical protein
LLNHNEKLINCQELERLCQKELLMSRHKKTPEKGVTPGKGEIGGT